MILMMPNIGNDTGDINDDHDDHDDNDITHHNKVIHYNDDTDDYNEVSGL